MRALKSVGPKLLAFAGLGLLAACVITTEKAYFTAADYVQPKALTGDWQSVPGEDDTEVLKVRIGTHGKLQRAEPLTDKGEIDPNEKPLDFGLVPLEGGNYVLVQADNEKGPYNYVGLVAQEDKLTFLIFSGGETDTTENAYKALLADLGIARDPSMNFELRLTGDVTVEKIKALFSALLADPEKYEAHKIVYVPLKK